MCKLIINCLSTSFNGGKRKLSLYLYHKPQQLQGVQSASSQSINPTFLNFCLLGNVESVESSGPTRFELTINQRNIKIIKMGPEDSTDSTLPSRRPKFGPTIDLTLKGQRGINCQVCEFRKSFDPTENGHKSKGKIGIHRSISR